MPLVICEVAAGDTCVVKAVAWVCDGVAVPGEVGFGAGGREMVGALETVEVSNREGVGEFEGVTKEAGFGVACVSEGEKTGAELGEREGIGTGAGLGVIADGAAVVALVDKDIDACVAVGVIGDGVGDSRIGVPVIV